MSFWDGLFHNDREPNRLLEMSKRQTGEAPQWGPLVASLLLTYRCNLACGYCPFHKRPERPDYFEVATQEWGLVIDRLAAIGVRRISFSGGEPTLYSGLASLIRRARDCGCITSLVTNGQTLESLMPRLKEVGLHALTVSVDSLEPVTYQKIHRSPPGRLQKILRTLADATIHNDLWVCVNVVLSRDNLEQLPDLIDACRCHSIPIQIQPYNRIPSTEDCRPDAQAVEAVVPHLIEARHPNGPILNSKEYLIALGEFRRTGRLPGPLRCVIPYVEMVITPDLGIQPCCAAPVVGHALQEDLMDVWTNQEYATWRNRASSAECKDCMLLYHELFES